MLNGLTGLNGETEMVTATANTKHFRRGLVQINPHGQVCTYEAIRRWAFETNDYSLAVDAHDGVAMPWPVVDDLPATKGLADNLPRRFVVRG